MTIFLSYSRGDAQQADAWVAELEQVGYRVWIDREGIRGGQQWMATTVRSIEEAQAVILLLSPNSARSDNVHREIDLALQAKKRIIPVEIQATTIQGALLYQLAGVQLLQVWRDSRGRLPLVMAALKEAGVERGAPRFVVAAEEQRRLEVEVQRKAEEELLREQERQRSEEDARRKADEKKEKTRAQRGPRIGTYDVFISFKNIDEKGVPTRDTEIANEVYHFLISKGLKVFISTETLESLGESDYSKAIDDVLDATSIVVAVGTSAENLNSEWVRYEWSSFYNDIRSRRKPDGKIFTYILGLRPAQLPRALRQTQTFIHSPEALKQLHGFIVQALR